MERVLGVLFFLASCLSVLWSLAGLFRPYLVLWWAVPEKQTRGRAFGFSLFAALVSFAVMLALLPGAKWWAWGFVVIGFGLLLTMRNSLRMTAKEIHALGKKQERAQKLNIAHTVYSQNSENEYEIRPFLTICSCPDWNKKRSGADGPFSVCKHLANHYLCHRNEIPKALLPYQDLIDYFSSEDKGLPPQGEVSGYGVIDGMAYIFTGYDDSLPWVNVYIDVTGTQRYGFNIESGKWAKQKEPFHAEILAERIRQAHHELEL